MTTQVRDVPAERVDDAVAASCPDCGAPLEPGQHYCVECGAQVGVDYRPHPSWRLPAAVAAIVVLLIGAGVAFALTEISSDSDIDSAKSAPTQAAATPVQPSQPTTAEAVPPAEQTAPQGEATAPTTAPQDGAQVEGQGTPSSDGGQSTGGGSIAEWPAGKAAYSVILFSTDTREGAEKKAREAIDQGIPAGVLDSSDYSSLRRGYWVVFAGQFDSRDEAENEAESYASLGFEDGYPRFVKK